MAKSPIDFTDTIQEEIDGVEEEYRLRIYSIDKDRYLTGHVYYKTFNAPVAQARPVNDSAAIDIIQIHARTVFRELVEKSRKLNLP